jgi:hypothetical protein
MGNPKMEAASSFETSVTVQKSTWCHVPEDFNVFSVRSAKPVLDISTGVRRLLKITNKIRESIRGFPESQAYQLSALTRSLQFSCSKVGGVCNKMLKEEEDIKNDLK